MKLIILLIVITLAMFKSPIIINSVESIVVFIRAQALRFANPKYLHADPDGYQALPFEEVLKEMTTKLEMGSDLWTLTTSYKGDNRPTTIILYNGYNPEKPTLIYHHGAGSTKPLKDFNLIFGKDFASKFNVFVVHAQYHASKQEYLSSSVDSFLHHQETFAGSVLAYEEIIKYHKSHSQSPVIATGSSMGGIVSSLHAFYYGTAEYYFPLVAYPNVGEIFLGYAYKTAVADWDNKRHNQSYLDSFKVKHIDPQLRSKVFPILGAADHIVPFEKSFKFWQDNGFTVKVFPYGHFTPGIAAGKIRSYITEIVSKQP